MFHSQIITSEELNDIINNIQETPVKQFGSSTKMEFNRKVSCDFFNFSYKDSCRNYDENSDEFLASPQIGSYCFEAESIDEDACEKSIDAPLLEEKIEESEEDDVVEQQSIRRKEFMDQLTALIANYIHKYGVKPSLEDMAKVLNGVLIVHKDNDISNVVVNKDLNLVFPDYNEKIISFPPCLKVIYYFFLKHAKGIVLKDLSDYKKELYELYELIQPNKPENLVHETIDRIISPLDGSINQKISKINRFLKDSLGEISNSYMIKGERGNLYKISIPENKISLPVALQ